VGLRPGHDYFEYAHSDYLQSLMEFGLLGCFPLFLFFLTLIVPAVLASRVRPSVYFSMLAGVLAFCLHAWWDFPAQCPSVLLLLVFILVIIGRWGTLDASKQRIDNEPL
jgi:O-antigen ligase